MKDNILIVDDEPDIRDTISAVLNDDGYETICASNAQEAQAIINKELPSLIILDILSLARTHKSLLESLWNFSLAPDKVETSVLEEASPSISDNL